MINIVIPMAGEGKRFISAGYRSPKPLIDVCGQAMIRRVIGNLAMENVECKFIFLCLKSMVGEFNNIFSSIIKNINHQIVTVDSVTEGAACTVLLAKDVINTEDELFISNCDQVVLDKNFMKHSLDFYRKNNANGGILCFLHNSEKWSYARCIVNEVVEVAEKKVVSPFATVGIYYYKSGRIFVQAAEEMIHNNLRVNGEFYIAPSFNTMIYHKQKVIVYLINEMVGLGTPEDLERAIL